MGVYIAGFIVAIVLAAIVVLWIAYCMFVRERHKSEFYHHNISDLQHRQHQLSMEPDNEQDNEPGKKITAGIFILPSTHKQKGDDYDQRPDYPESPVHRMDTSTEKLIEILSDDTVDAHYRDGIVEESNAPYQSDV